MLDRRGSTSITVLGAVAAFVLATVPPSLAQLSAPALTNSSNPNEQVPGTASTPSRERESLLSIVSTPSGAFTTQYTSLVTTDSDGAGASAGLESMASDYQLDFTVTVPGAYRLQVDTSISGDMHLVNDGSSASVDVSGVSGTQSGGTLESGSLDIADPGALSAGTGGAIGIADGSTATIFGVSNGSSVPHNLHFTFTQIATSASGGGDEAAVRLGINSGIATETAGDYPGSPARTLGDDGHFVTVTLTSLCGNGVPDSGPSYSEDCDEGANNGQPGSCCNVDCTFATTGSPCDDGNACTSGDGCVAGGCVGGAPISCVLCKKCDTTLGCVYGPRPTCADDPGYPGCCKRTTAPFKAKFQIKDKTPDTGDQVVFKWSAGEDTPLAAFDAPNVSDPTHDYGLCVFDSGGNRIMENDAPAGGVCRSSQCWKQLSIKGFAYKDPDRTPDGADKVVLKAGLAGKSKVQFKGKGANVHAHAGFPTFPLPLSLPATVQLQSRNGSCWTGTFDTNGTQANDTTQYKGKNNN
jgi:hypothetical protein